MSSLLQKVGAGLLDAFDLKTYGTSPTAFGDTVSPIADVMDHYLATRLRCAANNGNLQNINDNVALTVPNGTAWRLHCVGGHIDLNAADNPADGVGLEIGILPAGSSGSIRVAALAVPPKGAAYAAATRFSCSQTFDRPLILVPGTQLFLITTRTYAAARAAAIVVMIEELEV